MGNSRSVYHRSATEKGFAVSRGRGSYVKRRGYPYGPTFGRWDARNPHRARARGFGPLCLKARLSCVPSSDQTVQAFTACTNMLRFCAWCESLSRLLLLILIENHLRAQRTQKRRKGYLFNRYPSGRPRAHCGLSTIRQAVTGGRSRLITKRFSTPVAATRTRVITASYQRPRTSNQTRTFIARVGRC